MISRIAGRKSSSSMSEKQQLRQQVKQLKQTISSEQRVALSQNICSAIEKLPGFETVLRILLYHALPDEVDTGLMLSRWSKKKQLYLPIVNGDNLIVSPYDPRFLKQGAFGIWEPGNTRETDPGSIDWIIVPGVAFDKKLNRLGRGKGYYDKLLAQSSATKIGICYELQLFDEIPAEPHDIKMDFIITENNIIHRKDELWH